MRDGQISSLSHTSIMREAHGLGSSCGKYALNKAMKLLLAFNFFLACCLFLPFCGQALDK
jgi:hypothetical protein